MRSIVAVALAGVCLAGCDLANKPAQTEADKPAATETKPAETAFNHSQTQDLSGYYMPQSQVGPDDFQLITLFIGQAPEFQEWEEGKRSTTFGPIMMEFLLPGETSERVLPDSYSISDGRVRMSGNSADYGRVSLDAQLDGGALSTARRNLGDSEAPTLVGTITIGDQTFSGVKFLYSAGD